MTKIEEFLKPLHNGVWEVVIPKEDVTEPMGEEWKKSPINVPTPGTIASLRNGQYHVHETKNEWRVHLDRYDPKVHPFLHLIDDAPLFLMISETIVTLFAEARGRSSNTEDNIKDQEKFMKNGTLIGLFLLLLGLSFIISPTTMYYGILGVIIPLIVIMMGVGTIGKNIIWRSEQKSDRNELVHGGIMVMVGIILGYFPMILWNLILISILGIWMLSSAIMLLNRIRKGKSAVPEGFYSRFAIAIISLILVIAIFLFPGVILDLFLMIGGVVIFLLGCALISATFKLKERSKQYPKEI